ncbi:MAG: hypothetical protein GYA17_09205, partial [Chloroflexi bacterium]|nr:hypothetical protein [Chloroflexota bacterium]
MECSFEDAYQWLNRFDESHLCAPTRAILDQLWQSLAENQPGVAWQNIERLKAISKGLGPTKKSESAEIHVECARAALRLQHREEALRCLREASCLYGGNEHYVAVVKWMIGCLQWEDPALARQDEAIAMWSDSIEEFTMCYRARKVSATRARQYHDLVIQLEEKLVEMIHQHPHDCPPPPEGSAPISARPAAHTVPVDTPPGTEQTEPESQAAPETPVESTLPIEPAGPPADGEPPVESTLPLEPAG